MAKPSTSSQLKKYRSMRDFKKTLEPRGSDRNTKKTELRYLIQKHAATRLHYDFRLEMHGVLKSWAVTRGPSLDPEDKRLAVHVEDHPIEYGDFEGTIPKGEYGGGTVMLWDTGTWEPMGDFDKDYAKGKIHFRLDGERLKGEWVLLRMRRRPEEKRENWLLIKVEDKYTKAGEGDWALTKHTTSVISKRNMEKIAKGDNVWHSNHAEKKEEKKPAKAITAKKTPVTGKKSTLPKDVKLQLATLVDKPPNGDNWLHEIKFDGYRLLARIQDGSVQLLTRAGNDWTKKFQEIADELAMLKVENALIDGEVVSLDENDKMSFHALQNDLSEGRQSRMHYYAFDCLYVNGMDIRQNTLLERKEMLRTILPEDAERLHYSEHFSQDGDAVLQNACNIALEGIVCKRSDAPYSSGRGMSWLKVKCLHEQEFVIGGYTEQREHPGSLGALLIGYYKGKELHFGGKVGTGFTEIFMRTYKYSLFLSKLLGSRRFIGLNLLFLNSHKREEIDDYFSMDKYHT
ncbi:MAG: non-homologous end-joining DNA ligase [Rickettsiales bacterium]